MATAASSRLGRAATLAAVADPIAQPFAFHYGLPEIDALYGQGRVAVVLNVGSLVQPLTRAQYNSADKVSNPRPPRSRRYSTPRR